MKISWIKSKNDYKSFIFQKNMGFNVKELEDMEQTDNEIKQLIENRCNTIVLSNEVASFSQDIIKKYAKDENINIIIAARKNE